MSSAADFSLTLTVHDFCEKRKISPQEIARWFDEKNSAYGKFLAEKTENETVQAFRALFEQTAERYSFDWYSSVAFFTLTC